MDIIFKNITAITEPISYNIDIGVQNGKIAFIKPTGTHDYTANRIIDGSYKVLMPGLYNCHSHASMVFFRGLGSDRTLEDWLFNYIVPAEKKLTPNLVRLGTTLAIAEMISSGTIALCDMYYFCDETSLAAYDAGVLANISNGIVTFDENFIFENSNEYAQTMRALENIDLSDGRIKIDASIHGVYTSPPDAWRQVVEFAQKRSLRMHVHLSETKTEHENCKNKFGLTPTQVFEKHGVFDIPCLAAHGVWLEEIDIKILAKHGVSIAHCPLSNLKLASGLAPITKMDNIAFPLGIGTGMNPVPASWTLPSVHAAAMNTASPFCGGTDNSLRNCYINIALGTDGVASNNSLDMFAELKMASLLQKYITNDPTAMPALQTINMATKNGALALGREKESGQIAVGFDADIIMLDFDNVRQMVCHDPIMNIAYSTSGRDVELTMCRGKILYEKGEFFTIDIEKILYEAKKL